MDGAATRLTLPHPCIPGPSAPPYPQPSCPWPRGKGHLYRDMKADFSGKTAQRGNPMWQWKMSWDP